MPAETQVFKTVRYKKVVNRCFKYPTCDYVPKAIPSRYGCDVKQCDN